MLYDSDQLSLLDVLLDVSLHTPLPLNWPVSLKTRLRLYGNPRSIGGNACISNTALPPNALAPTTSSDRTRFQSISLLATSFEFGICVSPTFRATKTS